MGDLVSVDPSDVPKRLVDIRSVVGIDHKCGTGTGTLGTVDAQFLQTGIKVDNAVGTVDVCLHINGCVGDTCVSEHGGPFTLLAIRWNRLRKLALQNCGIDQDLGGRNRALTAAGIEFEFPHHIWIKPPYRMCIR